MPNEPTTQPTPGPDWKAMQVYTMAVICLVVGVGIGYLFRGSQSPAAPAPPAANSQASAQPSAPPGGMAGQMPTFEQMKQMADTKAAPLLEKLKGDPNNSDLLFQAGKIYQANHQFKEAAGYYDKALHVNPKNVAIRTDMASCLYYNGDVDGAISQLQQSLHYDPKNADSLFNLGMIKWQGKHDSKGAVAVWQRLLDSNQLSVERKTNLQKLMAQVQMQGKS